MSKDCAPSVGIFQARRQSHSWESGIATLPDMKTRAILSANLKALMAHRPELDTLKKITEKSHGSLSNGKLDRIRRATHTTDIETLGELADVFKVEAWQLLVPNLNPEALPQIAGGELLDSIKRLVASQESVSRQDARPSGTKRVLGRIPGQDIALGAGPSREVKSGEVNKPRSVPRKGHRGSS